MISSLPRHLPACIFICVLLAALAGSPAHADPNEPSSPAVTFNVNDAGDTPDFNVGDGKCDAGPLSPGDQCTLRAAIMEANATVAVDTINLYPNFYLLEQSGPNESNAVTGDLDILHDLTITGHGSVVDAGKIDRVFSVLGGAKVNIYDLIIQNGHAAIGAGVLVDSGAELSLDNSIVRDSFADGGRAGGIYNAQGKLLLRRSTVSNNYGAQGGGIFNEGELILTDSTVSGNEAVSGGGLYVDSAAATQISNSTISSNLATDGGGLYVESGAVTLRNVTVALNNAPDGSGGGIFGNVTLNNSIVAGNLGSKPDCAGTLATQGYNLLGSDSGCGGMTHDLNGDQVGTSGVAIDPLLGPLQDNGGWVATHALLPGSPAIDAGNPAAPAGTGVVCMLVDQRNVIRPGGIRCDIGAYEEVTSFTVTSKADVFEALPGDGVCDVKFLGSSIGCTLRAAIQEANLKNGTEVIVVPSGVYTLTFTGAKEDDTRKGDLDIDTFVVIRGAGSESTRLATKTGWDDRILENFGTTLIQDIAITGGVCCGFGDEGSENRGGAILNSGRLTLRDVVTTGNQTYERGGGIYNLGSWLALHRSTVSGNLAIEGGGIYHIGPLLLLDESAVSGNRAGGNGGGIGDYGGLTDIRGGRIDDNSAGAASRGGGIDQVGGALTMESSTVSGNQAGDRGGGLNVTFATKMAIMNSTISGNIGGLGGGITLETVQGAEIRSSTISGNEATESGGGLYVFPGLNLSANNVTISNNTADSDANGDGDGGGVFLSGGLDLSNSLIAGNFDKSGGAPDCQGVLTSKGYNLVEKTDGCTFSAATGDLTGTDPKLGPLQPNGGYNNTDTHALLAGSPAIDAGNPILPSGIGGACEHHDQRGLMRVDGDSDSQVRCDMGAYEASISKQPQAITFGPLPPKLVTDLPFSIAGKASASSGLPVSFSAAGVCTVSGETVTLSGVVGTCTITAHQPGNTNFLAAADAARSFQALPVGQPDHSVLLPLLQR